MASQDEVIIQTWHWRNTQKSPRFWRVDARAGAIVLLVILFPRKSTLTLFFLSLLLFWILERKGLSFSAALRAFRVWIIGPKRPAYFWTDRRKLMDID
ncbi:MAG: type IV secretion protein IcmT [Micavibrio sp.]|jgi:intracellular multiplication protein IcmT|nr:MAG: type IV secretion protein IcmT [Micavibrio sp.]